MAQPALEQGRVARLIERLAREQRRQHAAVEPHFAPVERGRAGRARRRQRRGGGGEPHARRPEARAAHEPGHGVHHVDRAQAVTTRRGTATGNGRVRGRTTRRHDLRARTCAGRKGGAPASPSATQAEHPAEQRAAGADRVAADLALLLADDEEQAVERLAGDIARQVGVLARAAVRSPPPGRRRRRTSRPGRPSSSRARRSAGSAPPAACASSRRRTRWRRCRRPRRCAAHRPGSSNAPPRAAATSPAGIAASAARFIAVTSASTRSCWPMAARILRCIGQQAGQRNAHPRVVEEAAAPAEPGDGGGGAALERRPHAERGLVAPQRPAARRTGRQAPSQRPLRR